MSQLTQHFSVEEYAYSDTALRMGIDNTPPAELIPNLKRNAELMEMIRASISAKCGKDVAIFLKSGYRCEALEKVVARSDFISWCDRHEVDDDAEAWRIYFARKGHPQGNCGDFIAPAFGTPAEIVKHISREPEIMRHVDQIICEGTWVHGATADKPRGQVMTASFNDKGIPTYSKGIA